MFGISINPLHAIIAALCLVLLGGGATAVWKYNHAIEAAQTAEHSAQAWKISSESWQKGFDQLEKDTADENAILEKRAVRAEASANANARLAGGLRGLLDSRDIGWRDSNVPAAVRSLRRTTAGCAPNFTVPCPAGQPAADAGAANAGRDKRGSSEGSGGTSGSLASVQR